MDINENSSVATNALDDLNDKYMLFYIDDLVYSIPLKYVREILNIHSVEFTYLPGIADYFRGIVNVRSKVVPVIDMRKKFGYEEREFDDKTCIIFIDINDMGIGFIVDSVSEVATLKERERAEPPEGGDKASRYLDFVAELNGKVILNIDCDKFFLSDLD